MSSKGLSYWARGAEGPNTFFPTVLELMQQDGFATAARRSAEGSLQRTELRILAGASSHDIVRFYYPLFILYLDMTGGVTRTRLVDFCTDIKLASPGRTVAILHQLRRAGHVELAEHQADRRSRLYRPSRAMLDEFRDQTLTGLRSLATLEPEVEQVIARFHDPAVFRAFILCLGAGTREFVKGRTETDISLFSDRNAGFATLFLLIASADPSDPFPPKGPLQASLAGLSKRLRVSRGHIFRLLRDAEKRGLIRRDTAKGIVWLEEPVRFLVAVYLSSVFLGLLASCHAALQAQPETGASLAAS